jgi:F-type H+-transporting ATPase subunit b
VLIDWFTIVAQLINFLILVFLLHRFLYRPIVKTIRTRQEEIDRRWQEVRELEEQAQAEAEFYEQKQEELAQKRQEIIAQAQEEGEREYDHFVKLARQQLEEKQAAWQEAIAQQQDQFFENLQQKVSEQVYEIARRAFQELADVELEHQAIITFIHRLENLDEGERQSLTQSLQKSDNGLVIYSSFELSPESRQQIIDSLHRQQIYEGDSLRFATAPELICGIELQASDYKIPWNLNNYLHSLEKHLADDFPQKG